MSSTATGTSDRTPGSAAPAAPSPVPETSALAAVTTPACWPRSRGCSPGVPGALATAAAASGGTACGGTAGRDEPIGSCSGRTQPIYVRENDHDHTSASTASTFTPV